MEHALDHILDGEHFPLDPLILPIDCLMKTSLNDRVRRPRRRARPNELQTRISCLKEPLPIWCRPLNRVGPQCLHHVHVAVAVGEQVIYCASCFNLLWLLFAPACAGMIAWKKLNADDSRPVLHRCSKGLEYA